MYQPTLARFMSRDLMPANGVTVLSPVPDMRKYWHQHADIAGYTYVANNPINLTDSSDYTPPDESSSPPQYQGSCVIELICWPAFYDWVWKDHCEYRIAS